jgi:uncharacterized protein YqhQ
MANTPSSFQPEPSAFASASSDGGAFVRSQVQLGGQALVEGVMMRSPRFVGAAVRRASGEIQTRVEPFAPIAKRHRVLGLPILRGVVGLVEMMLLGTRYLNWSSNLALLDSPEASKPGQKADEAQVEKEQSMPLWMFLGTVVLSLSLGFALFVALPNIAADATLGRATRNRFALNIAEGCIKITIFVAYLWLIGRMANIKRLFEFHGAEHKVVYAAEHGRPLTPDGARPFDTPHPRCGTGFALLTAIVSIACFSWLPWTLSHWPRVGMRFVLMPLVAGISYEILKLTAHPKWRPLAIVVMTPGMWLQRLTTNEPDDSQLEVSCAAMQVVIDAEEQHGTPVLPTEANSTSSQSEETELETV